MAHSMTKEERDERERVAGIMAEVFPELGDGGEMAPDSVHYSTDPRCVTVEVEWVRPCGGARTSHQGVTREQGDSVGRKGRCVEGNGTP